MLQINENQAVLANFQHLYLLTTFPKSQYQHYRYPPLSQPLRRRSYQEYEQLSIILNYLQLLLPIQVLLVDEVCYQSINMGNGSKINNVIDTDNSQHQSSQQDQAFHLYIVQEYLLYNMTDLQKYLINTFLMIAFFGSITFFAPLMLCPDPDYGDCQYCGHDQKMINQTTNLLTCCVYVYSTQKFSCISVEDCKEMTKDHTNDSLCSACRIIGIILYVIDGLVIIVGIIFCITQCQQQKLRQRARVRVEEIHHINNDIRQNVNGPRKAEVRLPRYEGYHRVEQSFISLQNHLDDQCAICTQKFVRFIKVTKRKCGHIFHRVCIQQWKKRSNTCPFCRAIQ